MTLAHLIFVALMALFPRTPARACLTARQTQIEAQADDAMRARNVPPGVLIAVGFMESHLGCDRASGGCWGAPISPTRRHTAGSPDHAARALETSFRRCGNWRGAISRFRCGLCRCPPRFDGYVNTTVGIVRRLYMRADQTVPDMLEPPPRRP